MGSGLAGGCRERGCGVSHIRSLTSVSQRFAADDSQPRCEAGAGLKLIVWKEGSAGGGEKMFSLILSVLPKPGCEVRQHWAGEGCALPAKGALPFGPLPGSGWGTGFGALAPW